MSEGTLAGIYIAEHYGGPMRSLDAVEAVAGRGLWGDRYFSREPSPSCKPDEEVSLIESEAIDRLRRALGKPVEPSLPRRNLLTRGVSLNDLVGKIFAVGPVLLEGLELCDPCGYLESITVPGIQEALSGSGGLRGRIVQGGVLHVGDPIRTEQVEATDH